MGHIAGVSGGVSKECHFELCPGLVTFLISHRHDFGHYLNSDIASVQKIWIQRICAYLKVRSNLLIIFVLLVWPIFS
jgi:hypothetical protein